MSIPLKIELLEGGGAWRCARISLPSYPLDDALAVQLRGFLESLGRTALDLKLQPTGVIQYNQLKWGRAGYILAENGPQWRVDWGLGYWPDRPPPTLWTPEEFHSLGVGEMPRPLMHQIFLLADAGRIPDARSKLIHSGCWAEFYSMAPLAEIKKRGTAQFQPLIEEMSLKSFAFYLPVLSQGVFKEEFVPRLEEWSCGIDLFIRQSPEDKGLFVATRLDMAALFAKAGATHHPALPAGDGMPASPAFWSFAG